METVEIGWKTARRGRKAVGWPAPCRALAIWVYIAPVAAGAQVAAPLPERTPAQEEFDPAGRRDPLKLEIGYVGDLLANVSGGRQRAVRRIDNLNLIATADLDRLAGIRRTSAMVQAFYNNGAAISGSVIGDGQFVSGIEAGARMFRLYEAWVEHRGAGDRWSVKAGLYEVNSEFDALVTSLPFVHAAMGMGTDLGQSGRNGPSTFPSTALALRTQVRLTPRLTLRAAVADGVPHDPRRLQRMRFRLGGGEGALLIGEADMEFGAARLIAGGWGYTARASDRFDMLTGAATPRKVRSTGLYLRGEAQLAGSAVRGMRGFARIGTADGRANPFDAFASAGVAWRGLIGGRLRDDTGIALAYGSSGRASRALSRAANGAAEAGETAIELTYRLVLTDWLSVQPDLQYIMDPGLDPELDDALVLGVRLSATLSL